MIVSFVWGGQMIEVNCDICAHHTEKVQSFGLYYQYRLNHQWVIEQHRVILCEECYHVVKTLNLVWSE